MRLLTLFAAVVIIGDSAAFAGQSGRAGSATSGSPQPIPAGEPVVQVGVFSYQPDGSLTGSAYDTDPNLHSMVYLGGTFCQVGAGDIPVPGYATHAWRFSGKVISKSTDEVVIQLTWQRVLDLGQPATAPEGSVQLTLRNGDRVPLDTVMSQSQSSCSVTNAVFEARYMPRLMIFKSAQGQPPVAVTGTSVSFGSDGRATTGRVTVRGASGGSIRSTDAAGGAPAGRLFDVDLWLVHSAPGKTDEVLHQALRVSEDGAAFAFAPVSIETPRGPVIVQITGKVALPASQRLVFTTDRRVTLTNASQAVSTRDRAPDRHGGNSITIHAMPGPTEVLSFEMPPLGAAGGGPVLPDQFSVRVRITPQQQEPSP